MLGSINSSTKARGARLEARISNEQKALFQQAATLSTRTLSEFVVASAIPLGAGCLNQEKLGSDPNYFKPMQPHPWA